MPIRVLLADDTEFMRRAISRLLETRPELEVVGEADDFAQTIQLANDLKPQVIVMDLHMPDEARFTPQEVESLLNHGSQLLAISIWNNEDAKALAESFGAVKLLDKMSLSKELIPAILQVALSKSGATTK
jgi:DNA-binding NarL/FixJ family response regulator